MTRIKGLNPKAYKADLCLLYTLAVSTMVSHNYSSLDSVFSKPKQWLVQFLTGRSPVEDAKVDFYVMRLNQYLETE